MNTIWGLYAEKGRCIFSAKARHCRILLGKVTRDPRVSLQNKSCVQVAMIQSHLYLLDIGE